TIRREAERREVHAVRVLRVDAHLRIVERPDVRRVHLLPRRAAIVAAVQTGPPLTALRLRLDHRVDDARIARRERDADPALHRRREPATRHPDPRLAAITAPPQRTARPATLERVRRAHPLPARRQQVIRIRWLDRDVHEAGLVTDELD